MEKTYSKVWTQFETQSMAFVKLRMGLETPKYLVRGYEGFICIYKSTEDHHNPSLLFKIFVKPSFSKEEQGFFKKNEQEYLLVGGDIAWKIVDKILPLL